MFPIHHVILFNSVNYVVSFDIKFTEEIGAVFSFTYLTAILENLPRMLGLRRFFLAFSRGNDRFAVEFSLLARLLCLSFSRNRVLFKLARLAVTGILDDCGTLNLVNRFAWFLKSWCKSSQRARVCSMQFMYRFYDLLIALKIISWIYALTVRNI